MFFVVSKVFWSVAQPSSAAMLLLAIGLFATWRGWRAGNRLSFAGFAALVLFGFSPAANYLFLPLEQRFAGLPEPVAADHISGIIMLGGFEEGAISSVRPGLALNEAGERLTGALLLARRLPQSKVIFTGGSGSLLSGATGEGAIGDYLIESGIASERIVLERQSRTTWENATDLRDMLHPGPNDRYVLVTSAFHMPRAVGTFRQVGFTVVPYPVDYRTRGAEDLVGPFGDMPEGLKRFDYGFKEWVGLLAYWLSGRSNALWPGP